MPSTKDRLPVELIYYEAYRVKKDAEPNSQPNSQPERHSSQTEDQSFQTESRSIHQPIQS